MINHKEHAELIKKAQLGDRECLSRLAEAARVHLREYVLAVTMAGSGGTRRFLSLRSPVRLQQRTAKTHWPIWSTGN